jgi:hypothetical protein
MEYHASYKCPDCQSTSCRKLSAIYEEEIAQARTTGSYSETTFGLGKGSSFGSFSSKSVIESELARKVAPPRKLNAGGNYEVAAVGVASLALIILLYGLFTQFSLTIGFAKDDRWVKFLSAAALPGMVVVIATIGGLLWKRNQLNTEYYNKVYLPALKRWERSYRCYRCGRIFTTRANTG